MLEIGQTVMDGWRIEKRLGSGASSEVYLVSRDELGQHFERALKYIFLPFRRTLLECGGDQTRALERWNRMLEELGNEIRMQEQLSGTESGRIVRYFDHKVVLNHNNTECEIFILMERLTPFLDFLEEDEEGMSVAEVVRLGREIADALAVCHANGVFHCDVKEGNLFVAPSGRFKLGDFGAAKYGRGQLEIDSMRGTESYLPPEILNPEGKFELNASVDLYALGIVLYRLLNDMCSPFMPHGASETQRTAAVFKRASGAAVPAPSRSPDLLTEVVLRALAVKPEQRFADAKEFSAALDYVMRELTAEQAGTIVCGAAAEEERTELIGALTRAMPTIWNTERLRHRKSEKKQWTARGRIAWTAALCAILLLVGGGAVTLRDYAQKMQGEYAQTLAEQERYNAYLEQFDYELNGSHAVLTGYHGADTEVEVPATLDQRKVTTIRAGAFADSEVTAVILPKTVETVEQEAFRNCRSLRSVTLPDSVTSIGASAFSGCTALEAIELPVDTVREDTFSGCTSLSDVKLAQDTKMIEARAFYGCSALEVIAIPKGVLQIGADAFAGTALTAVTVSRGCEYYKPNLGEQIWHWIQQEENVYSFPENCAVHYFD